MAKKAFSKISVSDIAGNCGLTRQSFYYHFKDKYDLMNWIYYTETARFMNAYDAVEHWTDGLIDLCYYMQQNKVFYINALNTVGQNSFPQYLHDYINDITLSAIENILNAEFDREKWEFFVSFFSTAFVAFIIRWANNGMKEDPDVFITKIRSLFDGSILSELENRSREENHPSQGS
jgi:probable dihydroxyacetone kinase regulator